MTPPALRDPAHAASSAAPTVPFTYPFELWQPMGDTSEPTQRPPAKELKERLTPLQYQVTQEAATEPPFTGVYVDNKDAGTYRCVVCHTPLFRSDTKYDSGSGWPSFWAPIAEDRVRIRVDESHGMVREEAVCATCDAHLGHRFPDGPAPTGQRFCMNSAALDFEAE